MEVKIGTNLTLEPVNQEETEKYSCRVVDVEADEILIDYPIHQSTKRTMYLNVGETFRVTFVDGKSAAYTFYTKILGRKKTNIPMLRFALPTDEEVEKIQRREYVRVETAIDVALKYDEQFYQFVTADVSAGGLAIYLNRELPLQPGDEVELTLVLPFMKEEDGTQYVHTTGEIIRLIEKDEQTIVPIQFIDTDEVDRKIITRFCFERQLINHRKEMLL